MEIRQDVQARVFRSFDQQETADHEYWLSLTPAERMGMMWQLAVDAWQFMGEPLVESRLSRHVVRIQRSGR